MIETSAGKQTVITMDKLPSKVMNNHVMLKMDFVPDDNTEYVTESGFKLILAGGEWNEATRMPRYGTVVRVPKIKIEKMSSCYKCWFPVIHEPETV